MKFRRKQIDVEAIQFLGTRQSCTAVTAFLGGAKAGNHAWRKQSIRGGYVDGASGPLAFYANDFLVRRGDGSIEVLRPSAAAAEFERVSDNGPKDVPAGTLPSLSLPAAPAPGTPAVA